MTKFDMNEVASLLQGNMGVDIELLRIEQALELYSNDAGFIDLNPPYQRGSVWSEGQQRSCIEYVLRGGKLPPLLFNCPPNQDDPTYTLVDGKQRLIAIRLFVSNKLTVFGGYYAKDIINIRSMAARVSFSFNTLETTKECVQWYLDMIGGSTGHTEDEINKAIIFRDSLEE